MRIRPLRLLWVCGAAVVTTAAVLALLSVEGDGPPAVIAAPSDGPWRADDLATVGVSEAYSHHVYLPLALHTEVCQSIPGVSYGTIPVDGSSSHDVENNPDFNLLLLGYDPVDEYKGLVYYNGAVDPKAPQLYGLFADMRTPVFSSVHRAHGWDWDNNVPLPPPPPDPPSSWPVTVAGFEVAPGEVIRVPDSGYHIGNGFDVMVLYASDQQITLKYTRDDNVARGYTIYVTGVCVEPSLLALYQSRDAAGRLELPGLPGGQPFGRARGTEITVGIRDNAVFLDPRSCKDWWQGRCP